MIENRYFGQDVAKKILYKEGKLTDQLLGKEREEFVEIKVLFNVEIGQERQSILVYKDPEDS